MSDKPLILHIETATDICSVCLSRDNDILAVEETTESYVHAEKLTLFIQSCMEEANLSMQELDAVSLSAGPGSFTGLRIGASVAKGICYALGKPLIAISSLEALASAMRIDNPHERGLYCSMIDARRMEVYCALFDSLGKRIWPDQPLILEREDKTFRNFFEEGHIIFYGGNGSQKCKDVLHDSQAVFTDVLSSSTHLTPLANRAYLEKSFVDPAYFSPAYLKTPNITIPKKRL